METRLALVAGLGKTGFSLARYLRRCNSPFAVFDTREHPANLDAFRDEFPGVEVFAGVLPESVLDTVDTILASPGIDPLAPVFLRARERGIPILGDIECLAREISAPVIAITGTNGKSTVTALVGEMARAAGKRVMVAGNIGMPVLDVLAESGNADLWVLELSSFQLELLESLKPVAATILNITPDHMDRHKTLESYVAAKCRIARGAQTLVYNREDSLTLPAVVSGVTVSFGLDAPSAAAWGICEEAGRFYLTHGNTRLMDTAELRIHGRHNWQNALAACALAEAAGIPQVSMVEALRAFGGLPHRCQWVREHEQVVWINDSKGTNVGATVSAIHGTGASGSGKIILMAGGIGKGADFGDLRAPVQEFVRAVVLFGADAPDIARALDGTVPLCHAGSLEEATRQAHALALPGDTVLFSPACASFDMFRDYQHRGESFTNLVNAL